MYRLLCCALCALSCSTSSAEILVQDGDYFAELAPHEPVRIIGGRVDELRVGGEAATIEGGSVGRIEDFGNTPITIRGGEVAWSPGGSGNILFQEQHPQITFEGYEFAVEQLTAARWRVTGQLLDFSSISIALGTDPDLCRSTPTGAVCVEPAMTFLLSERPTQPGDANGDGVVDLVDLNTIRNGFGSTGPGDLDGNGTVGLEDLNAVRNHFGESITPAPEPATTTLLLVGTTALCLTRWSRWRASRDALRRRGLSS